MNRRFILFSGVVMVAALFLGGCSASKATSTAPAPQSTSTQSGGTSGQGASNAGAPASTGNAGRRQGPAPVVGSVVSVSGDVLAISTRQGDTKVKVTGAQVQKTVDGTASDLTAGETVVVMGQQGSDGSFTANNIQIRPNNGAGLGGFQGQRQGQGQAPRQGQGQGQGPRAIFGSVVSLQGDNLTVKTQQGDTTQVKIAGATIEKTVDGTVSDLKAGETVMATGQQASDGTLSASFIQIRPAGSPAGGPARSGASQSSPSATPSGS